MPASSKEFSISYEEIDGLAIQNLTEDEISLLFQKVGHRARFRGALVSLLTPKKSSCQLASTSKSGDDVIDRPSTAQDVPLAAIPLGHLRGDDPPAATPSAQLREDDPLAATPSVRPSTPSAQLERDDPLAASAHPSTQLRGDDPLAASPSAHPSTPSSQPRGDYPLTETSSAQLHPITSSGLSTNAQKTLDAFFKSGGVVETNVLVDKYAEVKRAKIRVFESSVIKSHPPLRAKYLTFWNDTALNLIKNKVPKAEIEARIKKSWNMEGKYKALVEMGSDLCRKFGVGDKFQAQESRFQTLKKKIDDLEMSRKQYESDLIDGIRKGTLSSIEKNRLKKLISMHKEDLEKEEQNLNKMSESWRKAVMKLNNDGPPKARGRKRVNVAVTYHSASTLKKSRGSREEASNAAVPTDSADDPANSADDLVDFVNDFADSDVDLTDPPVDLTDPPVDLTDSPVDLTDSPVDPADSADDSADSADDHSDDLHVVETDVMRDGTTAEQLEEISVIAEVQEGETALLSEELDRSGEPVDLPDNPDATTELK